MLLKMLPVTYTYTKNTVQETENTPGSNEYKNPFSRECGDGCTGEGEIQITEAIFP